MPILPDRKEDVLQNHGGASWIAAASWLTTMLIMYLIGQWLRPQPPPSTCTGVYFAYEELALFRAGRKKRDFPLMSITIVLPRKGNRNCSVQCPLAKGVETTSELQDPSRSQRHETTTPLDLTRLCGLKLSAVRFFQLSKTYPFRVVLSTSMLWLLKYVCIVLSTREDESTRSGYW